MMIFVGDEVWALPNQGDRQHIPTKTNIIEISDGFLMLKSNAVNFIMYRKYDEVYFSEEEAYSSLNHFKIQYIKSNPLYKKMKVKRNLRKFKLIP